MKLHEVLGSQSQTFGQAEKCRKDLAVTFEKRRHLFGEKLVTFRPDAEGATVVVESQSSLQTTVVSELILGDIYFWGQLMAGVLLGSIPVALVYSFFVEYYVTGLTGSVKG